MAEFSDWLLSIGDGRCGDGMVDIPPEMFTEEDRLHSLTDSIFPDIEKNCADPKWLSKRAILCPTYA